MGSRRYYVEPEDRDILSVFEDKSKNGRVRKIRKETILKYFSITRCEPRRGIERSTVNLILTRRETFRETCHELQTFSSPIIHYSFSKFVYSIPLPPFPCYFQLSNRKYS